MVKELKEESGTPAEKGIWWDASERDTQCEAGFALRWPPDMAPQGLGGWRAGLHLEEMRRDLFYRSLCRLIK